MGIFESIGRVFNIGGAKTEILLKRPFCPQATPVSGSIQITGGQYEQAGDSIDLELQEYWTEYRGSGKHRHKTTIRQTRDSVRLSGPFVLRPGENRVLNFELPLPYNARLTTRETGWSLYLDLDIPKAIDPSARLNLDVRPSWTFLAILGACERGPQLKENEKYRLWDPTSMRTRFRLFPPDILIEQMDFVDLLLYESENGVDCELVVDLQEHNLADYFKAALGLDKSRTTLHLRRDQIMLPSGDVQQLAITEAIASGLQRALTPKS